MTSKKLSSWKHRHHFQRRVRLLIRDDQDNYAPHGKRNNLFVRLSSELAWDLQNQILSSVPSNGTAELDDDDYVGACWVPVDEQGASSSPSVEFLPLQITTYDREDGETIYASFNGGTIRCDDNVGTFLFGIW
jgi:hypothetical protein